jgi:hypothetical protein
MINTYYIVVGMSILLVFISINFEFKFSEHRDINQHGSS